MALIDPSGGVLVRPGRGRATEAGQRDDGGSATAEGKLNHPRYPSPIMQLQKVISISQATVVPRQRISETSIYTIPDEQFTAVDL